jgi:hypothetical protein
MNGVVRRATTASVTRALVTLLLVFLLAETTGVMSFFVGCADQCADEQAGSDSCLPGCTQCACCGMSRSLLDEPLAARPTDSGGERVWPTLAQFVAAPSVQEIAHVPKLLLA